MYFYILYILYIPYILNILNILKMTLYQIDAFAKSVFQGNPAAVVPLAEWLPDELLQHIAAENNLSETAYFVDKGDHYHLRWFTPAKEVRLCGHATLASAHVLFEHLGYEGNEIRFQALAGELRVHKEGTRLVLDFPADFPKPGGADTELIERILGVQPLDMCHGLDDILVRIESKAALDGLQPDFALMRQLDTRGLIVTTIGTDTDIASRCFFPTYGIDEDPVTGSAHTLLTPYWANILGRNTLTAVQGGARIGYLECALAGDRVNISGEAKTYLVGEICW